MSKDTKKPNTNPISEINNFSSTLFILSQVCKKPIEMSFSVEKISLDGGLLLLREIEARSGILQSITNCIGEDRHSGYINTFNKFNVGSAGIPNCRGIRRCQ